MTEGQKEEKKVSQRTRFHYVAAPFFIVIIIWRVSTSAAALQSAGSAFIKKLLERIKVCIESIMMKFPRGLCTIVYT